MSVPSDRRQAAISFLTATIGTDGPTRAAVLTACLSDVGEVGFMIGQAELAATLLHSIETVTDSILSNPEILRGAYGRWSAGRPLRARDVQTDKASVLRRVGLYVAQNDGPPIPG